MKFTKLLHREKERKTFPQLVRMMKCTMAFMLLCCMNVYAEGFSQTKVSLKLDKAELKQALSLIEKQSNVRFLYNQDVLKKAGKVSMEVSNAALSKVLDDMLEGSGITYKILEDDLVVLNFGGENDIDFADVSVTGRITDSAGAAISSASITIKGTKTGTSADANGNFSIVAADNATLVISALGFATEEIKINGQTVVNATLMAVKQADLNEVVVIGYGTANKRDLTGSIVKVSGKDIADKPNTNPVSSLQGKVAGLSVVNSGTPGTAPDIRIRGTVSIGQVHPLYVVDGIFNDNIDYINPNDIESLEILKDPSSLAIFGVRGATGVIAITTKRARAGQVNVNFNTTYGFKKLTDKIKMASGEEFKTLFNEERINDNDGVDPGAYDFSKLTASTDWIDAVTRTGNFNTNNLSITGSTEKNRFNFGLGYTTDEGIVKHEKLERLQLSFGDEFKVAKFFRMGINFNASRQNNPYDATWVLDAARKVIPLVSAETKPFRVRDPYGKATDTINANLYSGLDESLQNSGVVNPLVQLENEWNKVRNIEYRMVGSVFGELNLFKNITLRSTIYADVSTVNKRQYTPVYYYYNPISNIPTLANQNSRVQENDQTYRKLQQDHILTYKKNFGDHGLTVTGGFTTYYYGNFNRTGGSSKAYDTSGKTQIIPNDPRFWYVTNGFQDPASISASSSQSEYTTVSVLARLLYNYQNKYFINGSFRNDASSRIPTDNRNQQFWAVGAAWDITKENFMKSQRMFDFLKIKGSIGVLGNQTASKLDGTPLNYPFYPNLNTGANAVFGTDVYSAAAPEYIVNRDLKWETVEANEAGVELNAFKNRLHFEFNYFNRTTKNLMTYISRAAIGLQDKLENGGSIRNSGQEFTASWNQNITKDLTLSVGGNITFMKNKVLSLSESLPTGYLSRAFQNNGTAESRTSVGMPIGYFYGYVVEGIYQSYNDILNSPNASAIGAYRPGDFKFKDIAGPGGKGPDGLITADDRTMIGNPTPDFAYGGNISLSFKGLTLSVDVVGVYGNEIFRTWGSLESPFQRVNYSADKIDRWHGAGTSNWVPLVSQGDRYNYNGSTYNIEDGSYFRIRNLQLAYSLPRTLISKIKARDLRIFANVQNLKTWKNNYGYTAEYGGDATAFGYDNAGGAIPMITTFGLNVNF